MVKVEGTEQNQVLLKFSASHLSSRDLLISVSLFDYFFFLKFSVLSSFYHRFFLLHLVVSFIHQSPCVFFAVSGKGGFVSGLAMMLFSCAPVSVFPLIEQLPESLRR